MELQNRVNGHISCFDCWKLNHVETDQIYHDFPQNIYISKHFGCFDEEFPCALLSI